VNFDILQKSEELICQPTPGNSVDLRSEEKSTNTKTNP